MKTSRSGRRPSGNRVSGSRTGGPPAPPPAQRFPPHLHACTFNFTGGARLPFPYCNTSLDTASRVKDLLSRMTYKEKCAALDTGNPAIERLGVISMQGGESTHGVASGCGESSANSSGCPTSFPTGTGLGASQG